MLSLLLLSRTAPDLAIITALLSCCGCCCYGRMHVMSSVLFLSDVLYVFRGRVLILTVSLIEQLDRHLTTIQIIHAGPSCILYSACAVASS